MCYSENYLIIKDLKTRFNRKVPLSVATGSLIKYSPGEVSF